MTIDGTSQQPGHFVLEDGERIPLWRIVVAELRKTVDTRAGWWLLLATGIIVAAVLVIQVLVGGTQDVALSHRDLAIGVGTPMAIVLPVLGVLSVTSEWGQRTALSTFTLIPSRRRVVVAKLAATVVTACLALALAMILSVVANLAYGWIAGVAPVWDIDAAGVLGFLVLHAGALLTGFAFGALVLNGPAAIVLYFVHAFVLPGLFQVGATLSGWFADARPYLDLTSAQRVVADGDPSPTEWTHLGVAAVVWIGLPLVVGAWRLGRAEVR